MLETILYDSTFNDFTELSSGALIIDLEAYISKKFNLGIFIHIEYIQSVKDSKC